MKVRIHSEVEIQDISPVEKASKNRHISNKEQNISRFYDAYSQRSFCSETISWYNIWIWRWNTILTVFVTFSLFTVPFMIFFQPMLILHNFSLVVDILYSLDLFLRSRTGYIEDGFEERDLLKIRRKCQTNLVFVLDMLSFTPQLITLFGLVFLGQNFHYSSNSMMKCLRFHFVLNYFEIREEEIKSSTLLYRTLKYIAACVLVIHYTACGWFALACPLAGETNSFTVDMCYGSSWIQDLPLIISDKLSREEEKHAILLSVAIAEFSFQHNPYVTSLYWATNTATSTGYGDVHASTIPEKVYSIFAMLAGMMVLYGMTMGGMTSMLTNIDAKRSRFVHRFNAFRNEVERMGLPDDVKDLCLRYYDYLWQRWQGENIYNTGVLDSLPHPLRAKFAEASFLYSLIDAIDLFEGTDEAFRRNLSLIVKPMVFLQNQFIQVAGSIDNSLCFIQNGTVEVLDEEDDEVLAKLQPNKFFGQVMLAFDLPRTNSIRCQTNCDIFMIHKNDFGQVLANFSKDAQLFLDAIRRKCLYKSNQWLLDPPSTKEFLSTARKTNALQRRSTSGVSRLSYRPRRTTNATTVSDISSPRKNSLDSRSLSTKDSRDHNRYNTKKGSSATTRSIVEQFFHGQQREFGIHQVSRLPDGTEMMASTASKRYLLKETGLPTANVESEDTSWTKRLNLVTSINPKGKFHTVWSNFIALLSFFAGLYTTGMAAFTTTPGQEKTYNSIETQSMDLFDIAYYSARCNSTLLSYYLSTCKGQTSNDNLMDCLVKGGRPFSDYVTGSGVKGFSLSVPASYGASSILYNSGISNNFMYWYIPVVIDICFYFNIYVNLRTEVHSLHGVHSSFKKILQNYNTWNGLWMDILGILPVELLASSLTCTRTGYYHFILFARLLRIIYFFRYVPAAFARWESNLNAEITQIRTLKFVIYIYSLTHACACMFFWWSCAYAMQIDLDPIKTKCRFGSWGWFHNVTYESLPVKDYVMTMYWASTTMTSAGYGDITPTTTGGRIFALLTMIIGTVMYGWLVAVIASTLSNSETARARFKSSMKALHHYLAQHDVPKLLINRVLKARHLEWYRYKGTAIPGIQHIGQELPEELFSIVLIESTKNLLSNLPFFHEVDPSFIAKLCNEVKIYHYNEGDVIVYQGDLQQSLYIIKQGHCVAVTEDLHEIVSNLWAGDYFGELSLLFCHGSPRTVVSNTASEILFLKKSDIDKVFESFPVWQMQMREIEGAVAYKQSVLAAAEGRNNKHKRRVKMFEKYELTEVKGGMKYYGELCTKPSSYHILSSEDKNIKENFNIIENFLHKLLLPVTFFPLSKGFILYETVRLVEICATMVVVPLQFGMFPSEPSLITLQYFLDGLCLVDQYVRAHVMYYNDIGIVVTHPVYTAKHYLRTSFGLDLLSWFPYELIPFFILSVPLSQNQYRFISILRLNRFLQLNKFRSYFAFWFSDIRKSRRWLKHIRNILYGFFMHHSLACLLFLTACPPELENMNDVYRKYNHMVLIGAGDGGGSYCHEDTWLGQAVTVNGLLHLHKENSGFDQYTISFYWATVTLVCAGYGELHAHTLLEMVSASLSMVIGTIFYSSILGDMSANIQMHETHRAKYNGKLEDIRKFFRVYDVTKETQQQVFNYYYYLWNRTHGVTPDSLMVGLPPSLQTSVYHCMYNEMINEAYHEDNSQLDKETRGFFRLIASFIKPQLFMKNNIVCRHGDKADEMYFIERGEVAILDKDGIAVAKVLGPGQHFGEVGPLFEMPRTQTIKAKTNCDLNVLSKKDLDDVFKKFPKFKEQMSRVAEDRRVHGTSSSTFDYKPSASALKKRGLSFTAAKLKFQEVKRRSLSVIVKKIISYKSSFAIVWKHVYVIFAFLSASSAIYQVCFFNHNSTIYLLSYLLDIWFIADMVIKFHMNYVDQFSTAVYDINKVHLAYTKKPFNFYLDVIINVPLEIVGHLLGSDPANKLMFMSNVRLNRVLRLYKMSVTLWEWECDIRQKVLFFRIYKAFLFMLFSINTLGSIWYVWTVADSSENELNRVHGHFLLPWVDSLYWVVATMTSTGYGDIKPETRGEMLHACLVMCIGKIAIGYVLSLIAATLANQESLRVWYEQTLSSVKYFMNDLQFNKEVHSHVVDYYDFMWRKNHGVKMADLFPDLIFSLRVDICHQVCREMIDGVELFKGCSENFLHQICTEMTPTAFMPGDYITLQGDVPCEMYLIHRGVAEVVEHRDGVEVYKRLVLECENFLSESLLRKVQSTCSLRARTYVDVFSMSMSGLENAMVSYPDARAAILENALVLFEE